MNQLLPETAQPVFIDCFEAEFPASDPQSAMAYSTLLMSAFDFATPVSDEPFAASTELFMLPDVTLSWAKVTASRFTRSTRTIAARGTDQILVVCYRDGYFDMTVAGEKKRVQAGDLAFIDLAQEIAIEAPRVDNISLALSRRTLEGMVPFLDGVHGFVRPADTLSKLLRDLMEDVAQRGPGLPVVDARGVAAAILQLVVACLEPLSRQPGEAGRNTVSLVAIKAHIDEHLTEATLGPQALQEAFGITRSTLYRLFEPAGGVSAFIAQRKLHHAFRLLSDTRTPRGRISTLAGDLGFSHPSAFTRAFKEAFGMSPKDVQGLAEQSREQEVQLLTSPEPLKYLRPIGPR